MLRLPEFNYVRPKSVEEAAGLLADLGPEALAVAGGTDLYPKMKRGEFTPRHLISVRGLEELRGIRPDGAQGMWIGAGETLTRISQDQSVRKLVPALASAAGLVSTPQLRNTGTIGGNVLVDPRCNYYDQSYFWRKAAGFCLKKDGEICHAAAASKRCLAVFSSDTAPVLVSLNAVAYLRGRDGRRTVPFDDLYREDGANFLKKANDEILQGILIPQASFDLSSVYLKLARRDSFDFPILGVAAAMSFGKDGVCRSAKLVLSGVSSAPKVLSQAASLVGKKVTNDDIAAVAEAAFRLAHPMENADLSQWYRKRMAKVYVTRALSSLSPQTS